MSASIIIRDDSSLTVSISQEALAERENVLAEAALIQKVESTWQRDAAVTAQKALTSLRLQSEKDHKAVKAAPLKYCKAIDAKNHEFVDAVAEEELRLSRLIGDYETLMDRKIRSAEASENQRLSNLERERHEAISKANSTEEVDAINEQYDHRAAQERLAIPNHAKAADQALQWDWDITVTDALKLANEYPQCVKIEVRKSELKEVIERKAMVLKTDHVQIAGAEAVKRIISRIKHHQTQDRTVEIAA